MPGEQSLPCSGSVRAWRGVAWRGDQELRLGPPLQLAISPALLLGESAQVQSSKRRPTVLAWSHGAASVFAVSKASPGLA